MSLSFLKKLTGFAFFLIVLVVFFLHRQVPQQKTPYRDVLDSANQLKMARGGQVVQFVKESSGWAVQTAEGKRFPTDENQMTSLLSSLKNVALEEMLTDRVDRIAEYEVDAGSGTHVSVLDAKGEVQVHGYFGKQATDMRHIFYRPGESNEVYLARGLYRADLGVPDPLAWRSRQLIQIPAPQIKQMEIEVKGKKTILVRTSTDVWTMDGKAVSADPVNGLVGTLANFRADSYSTPADPAITYEQLTYARIRVHGDSAMAEVRVGIPDKKTPRYPLSSGPENGIAWLSKATVDSILQFKPPKTTP